MSYKKEVVNAAKHLSTGIYHSIIRHDDWCGIFQNKECNCKPEIQIVDNDEYLKMLSERDGKDAR